MGRPVGGVPALVGARSPRGLGARCSYAPGCRAPAGVVDACAALASPRRRRRRRPWSSSRRVPQLAGRAQRPIVPRRKEADSAVLLETYPRANRGGARGAAAVAGRRGRRGPARSLAPPGWPPRRSASARGMWMRWVSLARAPGGAGPRRGERCGGAASIPARDVLAAAAVARPADASSRSAVHCRQIPARGRGAGGRGGSIRLLPCASPSP